VKLLPLIFIIAGLALVYASSGEAQKSSTDLYKVGINDTISITVLEHPDLKTITTVSSDGTITFPYLGNIYVKGMSISEIEKEITKRLSDGYVKYPVVAASLIKSMSRIVFTYGEFNQRGVIAFEDNMTLLNALSLAGGVSKDGLFGILKVKRKKEGKAGYEEIVETSLNNGLIENNTARDMIVKRDDILIIERNKTFLIQGEVANRGRFVLEKGMTVLRALLQAGGVNTNGLYGSVKIRRKKEGTIDDYTDFMKSQINEGVIQSFEVENTLLEPDDIMVVESNKTFLIQGEVLNRGRIVLEKDMTVLRALLQAGGVTKDGLYGKIKVRRKQDEKSEEYTDIAESNLKDGVVEDKEVENIILKPDDILIVDRSDTLLIQGEVAQRGRIVLEKGMTVLRALLQAGGVTKDGLYGKIKVRRKQDEKSEEYTDIAESNLNDGVVEDKEVENIILKPDDILIVERNKTFFIYGEINRPGELVLQNNMTVFKAITISGGFTKWGSSNKVKVLRQTQGHSEFQTIKINVKDVIEGDATKDIQIQSGDIIVVSTGIF